MTTLTKRHKLFADKVEQGKIYSLEQALTLLKACATAKFKESVDMSINLGVDAKKSDQNVRGSTTLPHGNGKTVRVAVFAQGAKAAEAKAAGADEVGMEDLAQKMKDGDLNFGVVIASPDTMRIVGGLGQVLGPRGLMPNPKTGTVTEDTAKAVKEVKAGRVEFKMDKAANVQVAFGKLSFEPKAIAENAHAVISAVAHAKPATAKGRFIESCTLSSTMGPGLRIDTGEFGSN